MDNNCFNIIGLITITVGAILLTISSEKQINSINGLMNHIKQAYGRWSAEPISDIDNVKFDKNLKTTKWLSKLGYLLFIAGFVFQLISVLK